MLIVQKSHVKPAKVSMNTSGPSGTPAFTVAALEEKTLNQMNLDPGGAKEPCHSEHKDWQCSVLHFYISTQAHAHLGTHTHSLSTHTCTHI